LPTGLPVVASDIRTSSRRPARTVFPSGLRSTAVIDPGGVNAWPSGLPGHRVTQADFGEGTSMVATKAAAVRARCCER